MNCVICGNHLSSTQSKCPTCGTETNISTADFLFEFNCEDKKAIEEYYTLWEKKKSSVNDGEIRTVKSPDITDSGIRRITVNETTVDYEKIRRLAEQGDAENQYELGIYYLNTIRSAASLSEAFRLFNRSAKQENADAQLMLAKCYENGYGTVIDEKMARKWYRRASKNGKAEAKAALKRIEPSTQNQKRQNAISNGSSNKRNASHRNAKLDSNTSNAVSRIPTNDTLNANAIRLVQSRKSVGQRIGDFFHGMVTFFRVFCSIILSILMGAVFSFIVILCLKNIVFDETIYKISGGILLVILVPLLLKLYSVVFEYLDDHDALFRWLSRELVITPIMLSVVFVGGMLGLWYVPALKYKVAEFQLNQGKYSDARTMFEELNGYNDSVERAQSILEKYPTSIRKGDIIRFGTYEQDNNLENGKEDIEWQVVYGNNFNQYASYVTLISKNAIEYMYFDTNDWENSSLRYWLNNDFLNEAFAPEQQAVLDSLDGYCVDMVDILVIGNKNNFPMEVLNTNPTEYARSKGSLDVKWCFRWTNQTSSFEANTMQVSYVDESGIISDDVPDGYFYIRPVIRLRIYAYENLLENGDNYYTNLYHMDLSNIVKEYTGTYEAEQGTMCMDLTIISCDKFGNIDAEIGFYAHESDPSVPSGRYRAKGCIIVIDEKDGTVRIDLKGSEWVNQPKDFEMLDLQISINQLSNEVTGSYQLNLKSVESYS